MIFPGQEEISIKPKKKTALYAMTNLLHNLPQFTRIKYVGSRGNNKNSIPTNPQ